MQLKTDTFASKITTALQQVTRYLEGRRICGGYGLTGLQIKAGVNCANTAGAVLCDSSNGLQLPQDV